MRRAHRTADNPWAFNPSLKVAYTPTTGFTFSSGGAYTPETSFVVSEEAQGNISGDFGGISGAINGTVYHAIGGISGTFDDLSGVITGQNGNQTGVIVGTLDDLTGYIIGGDVYSPSSAFSFGADSYTPQTTFSFGDNPIFQGDISGTLEGLAGDIAAFSIHNVGALAGTLEGLTGAITGEYDVNVHRYSIAKLCALTLDAGTIASALGVPVDQSIMLNGEACAPTQDATPVVIKTRMATEQTVLLDNKTTSQTEDATHFTSKITAVDHALALSQIRRCGTVDDAAPVESSLIAGFDLLEFIRRNSRHPVDDSAEKTYRIVRFIMDNSAATYAPQNAWNFAGADYTPGTVWGFLPVMIEISGSEQRGLNRKNSCAIWSKATPFNYRRCAPVQDARKPPPGTSIPVDPPLPPPTVDPEHQTFTIPTQTVYQMQHTITATLLDLTPINLSTVNVSLDAEAFAWTFRGTLADKNDLPLVQAINGYPAQLIITINGYEWRVLVERIEHGRKFAERTITLSGRGLTALLGQPYEQPASANQGSLLTVQQIADLHLPPGWTIDWQTVTWNVTGGAYSYTSKTPIQAINDIAGDIGAMLVPSRNTQAVTMLPRYPTLPWNFDAVPVDVEIPEAAILNLVERPNIDTQANGVYVHGSEIGGQIGFCRRTSTAGDRRAPTVSNALMTDVIGLRALGERILGGQHQQPAIQSATLPMDNGTTFPLIELGQLIEITLDATPIRGIVNAISIDASLSRVRQTIQIGEETPNNWAKFKELLPRDPLLFATLGSTDGTTSLVTLMDGGVVRVRGTGNVGGKYYIRGGKIDGEAPVMVQHEIVI